MAVCAKMTRYNTSSAAKIPLIKEAARPLAVNCTLVSWGMMISRKIMISGQILPPDHIGLR